MTDSPDPQLLALQAAVAGRYSVDREIGRGGMGVVYLAQDIVLLRMVAIKLLLPELARRDDVRQRFLREARTVAALSHPHIVPIHGVEERGDLFFFVMSYVEGESLRQRVERAGPLAPSAVTTMVRDVAWALGYAHGRGIVHRDVKPDNILLERATGRELLTDFGIARRDSEETLSGAGELVGTLQYMSPEQAVGETVDGRSDLYSLGLTAVFALTGRPPIEGGSVPVVLGRVLNGPGVDVDAAIPDAPDDLRRTLGTMVARTPDDRPTSGEALARELDSRIAPEVTAPTMRSAIQTCRNAVTMLGVSVFLAFPMWLRADFSTFESWQVLPMFGPLLFLQAGWIVFRSRVRALVREGFGFPEVQRAVAAARVARREERRSDATHTWVELHTRVGRAAAGPPPGTAANWRRQKRLLAVFTTLALLGMLSDDRKMVVQLAVIVLPLVIAWWLDLRGSGVASKPEDETRRRFSFDLDPARLLTSRLGRWSFEREERAHRARAARRTPAPANTSSRAETIALDRVADALALLPAEMRSRLGDVRGLAEALESKGALLRQRLAAADAGVAAVPPDHAARAAFQSVRDRLAGRVTEVNAALDAIRIDLLRAAAGMIADVAITEELQKARELGAAIDAELHGMDEIKKLLP